MTNHTIYVFAYVAQFGYNTSRHKDVANPHTRVEGSASILALIELNHLTKTFKGKTQTVDALKDINLQIAQNKANLPLFGGDTLFRNAFTKSLSKAISPYTTLIIIFLIVLIAKILLDLFLRTKCGYLLRAAGDNPSVVTTLSRDQGTVKILGLIIANALVALAGAVMCQQQRFFDISMGTGTMVAGLASVIIGTNLFRHASFLRTTTMVLIGSILYKACVSIAISFGLDAQDMKLITAVLFLAILVLSNTRKKKVRIHA